MSEAYRQKLLNWWCTMALVSGTAVTCLALFLVYGRLNPVHPGPGADLSVIMGVTGGTMIAFAPLLMIGFSWHFFDFIEKEFDVSEGNWLGAYRVFSSAFAASAVALCTTASNIFTIQLCPPIDQRFGFFHCVYGPPRWLQFTSLFLLLFASILCMGKAVIAIRSRLKKAS